jgi:hypothetical protein
MTLNKSLLVHAICEIIEADLTALKEAAHAAHKAATDPENKAENAYDTRGLEASYLAGAQAKRVTELEEVLFHCRNMELKTFKSGDAIAPSALVEIDMGKKTSWVFIVVKGAGLTLTFDGKNIRTLTASSPLAEALAEVEQGGNLRTFEIVSVL